MKVFISSVSRVLQPFGFFPQNGGRKSKKTSPTRTRSEDKLLDSISEWILKRTEREQIFSCVCVKTMEACYPVGLARRRVLRQNLTASGYN